MRFYEWTVKVRVGEEVVADGFDLTDEHMRALLARAMPYANGNHLQAEVVSAPPADEIAREQGYKDAADKADKTKYRLLPTKPRYL